MGGTQEFGHLKKPVKAIPKPRRVFLRDLGKGTVGVLVLAAGLPACGGNGRGSPASPVSTDSMRRTETPASENTGTGGTATPGASAPAGSTPSSTQAAGVGGTSWQRVNLGAVSAYVLSRSGEAAIVDTGVGGSQSDIRQALLAAGLDWDAVRHVILTHRHGDHIGSVAEVMNLAPGASGYAGAGDLTAIRSPRALNEVGDGDSVFGLEIIETPGHTAGHVSVLDRAARLLVAGDALNGADGGIAGPNPQFTADMSEALRSVAKLATFEFEIAVFGHGDPVVGAAAQKVAALKT